MNDVVTFVGVGAIGLPMAAQVAAGGYRTTGVDPLPNTAERVRGTKLVGVVDHITKVDELGTVVVMVATPAQLAALVDDALTMDLNGTGWVIMSTVGPEAIREQGERLRAAGAIVVDSPVSGGIARAETGSLTLFTSGRPADVDALGPVIDTMGPRNVVGEEIGDGQAFKLINQHLCSIHIAAAAEALALAERMGLDPEKVLRAIEGGGAGSWMLSDRGPRMVSELPVEVRSAIGIFVKDAGMVVAAGHDCGAQVPLAEVANQRYQQAAEMGLLREDDSQVIRTYR